MFFMVFKNMHGVSSHFLCSYFYLMSIFKFFAKKPYNIILLYKIMYRLIYSIKYILVYCKIELL